MPASDLTLKLNVDASKAVRGVDDFGRALEDVADEIDVIARESGDSASDVVQDFRKIGRAAKDAEDDIDDAGRQGFRNAGNASGEFKDEALSNFSEVTSSFTGDMESITDLAQGTFGGLASLGGGLGIAAGVAAAGIGLIAGAFTAAEEERAKLEERAGDLASAYIDAGSAVLDAVTIAARSSEVLTDPEQRKEAEKLRDVLGVDLATAVRALAGDQNALAVANGILADSQEKTRDIATEVKEELRGLTTEEQKHVEKMSEQYNAVQKLNEINGMANDTFRTQQDVLRGLISDAGTATVEVDELGNELYTLPDGTQIMIDAETKQATTDIQKFKGDVDGIPEIRTTTARIQIDDSAVRAYRAPTLYIPGRINMHGLDQAV